MITSKYNIAGAVAAALLLASAPTLAEDIPNNYIENFTDGDLEGLTGFSSAGTLEFNAETAPKPNPTLAWNVDDNAGSYYNQTGQCKFVSTAHTGFILAPQKDGANYSSDYAACTPKRGKDSHGIGRQVDNIVPGATYYLSGDGANKGSLRWAYSYSKVGAPIVDGLAEVTTVNLTNIVVSDNAWITVTDSFVAPDDIDLAQPFIVFIKTPPSEAYPKTGGIFKDERAPMWVDNLSLMGPPQDGGDNVDSDGDGVQDDDDAFPNDVAASIDTDNDGAPDSWNAEKSANDSTTGLALDAFPNDVAASIDTDNDGAPDSWNADKSADDSTTGLALDVFPNDVAASIDTDNDGAPDSWNDGYSADDSTTGLALDAFPNDVAASIDTDGDGAPDSWNDGYSADDSTTGLALDLFPNQANDADGDGVSDGDDAFPDDIAASIDTDNDGAPDSWNDGYSADDSTTGLALDLFPNDANDAADIVTAINAIETAGTLSIDATGADTEISPAVDAFVSQVLAEAGITGVSVNSIDGDALRSSGSHNLTVALINNAGSIISFDLVLNIIPTVFIPETVVVSENKEIAFNLDLSGAPLLYPVTFSYRFETMEEVPFIIDEAVLTIDEGETLSVVLPGQVIGDYQVVFFEGSERNAAISANSVTKIISLGNTAPAVDVALLNNGEVVTVLDQTANAAIAINITDIDMDTEHSVVVTINNVEVFNATNDVTNPEIVVPVDADALASGSLDISVVVTELATDDLYSASQTLKVSVEPELAVLTGDDTDGDGVSDSIEGYGDDDGDGIANYLDDSTLEKHQQNIGTGDDAVTITVDEGLTLSIGDVLKELESGLANSIGVEVATMDDYVLLVDVAVDDQGDVIDADIAASLVDVKAFLIPLIDFKITGANAGEAVNIIIPLPTALPINSEYRKVQEDGSLVVFDTNNGNTIKSAISDAQGDCPAADSIDWQSGLNLDNDCVKLTIVDGGVNDADGEANGVIVDPAVIVEVNSAPTDVSASASSINIVGGGLVDLTASASDADNDDLTYSWVQTAGETVTVFNDADKKVAMIVGPNATTTLTFEVTVSDGVSSTTASVNVEVSEVGEEKTSGGGSLGTSALLFLAGLAGLRRRAKRNL
ncbi:choice-of-anchor U domain-containing protein [Colwellia piezophila]|uniref:choice-of-anchor U domain-containing protein n=1 Tax=Colwellia piezophila TaxID=211668 RepID=UPI00035FDDE8|nr:choice-of-anchor U domain-containing protein [Colwellia piezophila]